MMGVLFERLFFSLFRTAIRTLEIHHIGTEKSISLHKILSVKINYIGMVRGKNDWIFLKLKNQLNKLKMSDIENL